MSGIGGISSDRNYETLLNSAGKEKTENIFGDAVFADKNDDSLSVSDFFNLMITQLTNQDFMNPVDDTQYLAQLAQFSTMQQMMDLAQFSKTNYATSLIGKEVTVAKTGALENDEDGLITGIVDRVSIKDDTYYVQVNGEEYSLTQIRTFGLPNETVTEKPETEKIEIEFPEAAKDVTAETDVENNDEVQFWL